MSVAHRLGGLRLLATRVGLLGSLAGLGCGSVPGAGGGETVSCGGEQRVQLDCSSEVQYQGAKGEAGIEVLDVVGAKGSFEERAIRRVNDQIQEYIAMQTRACRDYNACVLDAEQYRAEAADIRKRIMLLPTLTEALRTAKSETERQRVLDQLYRGVVPADKRDEEVSLLLGLTASIPAELGGGDHGLAPGSMVPTGALLRFAVDVSRDAYVYMFQTTKSGDLAVLFPNAEIGTSNPLRAGKAVVIPPGDASFRVNDKDIGTERVYVVVSRQPVASLGGALERVKRGEVTTVKDDRTLRAISLVESADAPASDKPECKTRALELTGGEPEEPTCSRTRGIDVVPSPGARKRGIAITGMSVRTSPGDDVIIQVFPFDHVTAAEFKKAGGVSSLKRGIVIED